jgi:molybdenum cofactor cytidylyltransferase
MCLLASCCRASADAFGPCADQHPGFRICRVSLADQPHIPGALVRALIERHAQTQPPIVAPMIEGKRGNPILFDRAVFPDLMSLQGDAGGRLVFSRYPIAHVSWNDPTVLLDVDTLGDYERRLNSAP